VLTTSSIFGDGLLCSTVMFLRCTKNGKTHVYWNIVENERLADRRLVQRYVLYHGEINSSQLLASRRTRSRNLGAVDAENA
jgi:hypothetical protein